MTREHINEYFNGRPFMLLCALAMVATAVMALSLGIGPAVSHDNGIFFSLNDALIVPGPLSATVNVLCLLATGFIMLAINKVFTYVRSMTHLFASAFFLLQMAHPQGLTCLNAGTLICLTSAITLLPLFASYQDRHAQRSIFLIFALVATGSIFHYGFLALIPAYLLGFLNLRALNVRGFLAMLFGLITPFWIVLGLRLASPDDFAWPHINGVWNMVSGAPLDLTLILTSAVGILGIVLAVSNLFTIMNYRMQTRVYNVFFIIMLVMVVFAIATGLQSIQSLLPLLSLMVAVQVAQAHTLNTTMHYRFVFMLFFIVCCVGFAAAQILRP